MIGPRFSAPRPGRRARDGRTRRRWTVAGIAGAAGVAAACLVLGSARAALRASRAAQGRDEPRRA